MLENMTTEMWIGAAAFVVGLIFVFGAAFRKQAGWKINPMWSGVIGCILIVGGAVVGVMPMLEGESPTGSTTVVVDNTSPTLTATFDVEIESGGLKGEQGNITVGPNGKSATWALDTYGSNDNTTQVNFTFSPNPPSGATADDLASIYFTVDQYSSKQYSEYMYAESGDDRNANWTAVSDGTTVFSNKVEKGQVTMLMTESGYANVTMELNEDWTSDDAWSDYGTRDLTFTFSNGAGWSETFTISVVKLA